MAWSASPSTIYGALVPTPNTQPRNGRIVPCTPRAMIMCTQHRLDDQIVADQVVDQLLAQQLMSVMMPVMPMDAIAQARRMGPGLVEAMIMQEVLQAALEQQPLTADALGLLRQGPLHVLEMHADGSVTELLPPDHVVPQEVAELRRFKQLVDQLQQQQVKLLSARQQRTARSAALGVCLLLVGVAVGVWARSVSDWADMLQRVRCRAVLWWHKAAQSVDAARDPQVPGAQQGRGVLPAWKEQKGRGGNGSTVAVRAVSGVSMPRARPAAGGPHDD